MQSQSVEVNFDGLVGPTHNFAGLSFGNVASSSHGGRVSSPKQAALQGLKKMKALHDMGMRQAVLPPHERPHIPSLKRMGFQGGNDAEVLAQAAKRAPNLLATASSASCMWVANAATVSPFSDSADGKTHFTPANLISMPHRSLEPEITSAILKSIFSGDDYEHHDPLPATAVFSDEGAANHTRFCNDYGESGVEFFVYGSSSKSGSPKPVKFPARQTREAFEAITRSHKLEPNRTVFAQQNPAAIDGGVFHNDVIAVGNRNLLFFHEQAFLDTAKVKRDLDDAMASVEMRYIEVPTTKVSLDDAVASYLFNSQLLSLPGKNETIMVVPFECQTNVSVRKYLEELEASQQGVDKVVYYDLGQSMSNGGGPACLRLRVVMSYEQIQAMNARVFLDESLLVDLEHWINKNYRDQLHPRDLADPSLLEESRQALDELTGLLRLGSIYEFQQ
ncbi:MAG: N-succinylarginine dihydrolase [Pseudohongiellaceae bacterium]